MSYPVSTQAPPLDWPHYGIGFIDAIKRGFTKYAKFDGRASRSEFWWWYLGFVIMIMVPTLIAGLTVAATQDASRPSYVNPIAVVFGILALLVFLALLVPTIAAIVRRLHDTGQSGGLACLWFIPYVGGLIVLILCAQATSPRAAQYGPPYPPGLPQGGYGAGYGTPYPPQQQYPGYGQQNHPPQQ